MNLLNYVFAIFNREFAASQKSVSDLKRHVEELKIDIERRDQGIKRLASVYHRVNMLKIEWIRQLESLDHEQGHAAEKAFRKALDELEDSLKPDTKDQA